MPTLEELLLEMLQTAPDPNEPLPVSNRKETIYGAVITFLIVCWLAVSLRVWVRLYIVRDPGWDDFFIVTAFLLNMGATVCVLLSVEYGLGRHYLYIGIPNMKSFTLVFYIENAIYVCNTAIIKISLLLQYLRIFKSGTMRWICISLVVIITIWGFAYGFMSWFPCFPVKGFWDREVKAKCYGYGFENREDFASLFISHSALNMAFDLAVFLIPMVLFTAPRLTRKNMFGLAGIFLLGAVVVFTAIWRLHSIFHNRAATKPYIDFTWWSPISIVLSCLEIDLAIMCASMPIFWPVLEAKLSHIFVTKEVHVTTHHRLPEHGLEYELEHAGSVKSGRTTSGASQEGLTKENTKQDPWLHYKDQFVVAQVDPLGDERVMPGVGTETEIQSHPGPKWRM